MQILDSMGATIATYDYDPWGNLLSEEPTDPRIQGQPIRYAGYVYDTETELYYLQARYYDPSTARFISRDPHPGDEDEPTSMNGYAYADDNPVMMVDSDGNWAFLVPVLVTAVRVITTVVKAASKGISKTKGVTKPAMVTKGIGNTTKGGMNFTKTTSILQIHIFAFSLPFKFFATLMYMKRSLSHEDYSTSINA